MEALNSRLLARMLDKISTYKSGSISLMQLAAFLESSIDAMEPPLPGQEVNKFYDIWSPLEIICATSENEAIPKDIDIHLNNLVVFLSALRLKSGK